MSDFEQHPDAADIDRALTVTAAEYTERERGAMRASIAATHDALLARGIPEQYVHLALENMPTSLAIYATVLATLAYVDSHATGDRPLEDRLTEYLTKRQHTLSYEQLDGRARVLAQAEYVLGEAEELVDAVETDQHDVDRGWVFDELADVVLAATTLARYLNTTVEACIERKTTKDTGRG